MAVREVHVHSAPRFGAAWAAQVVPVEWADGDLGPLRLRGEPALAVLAEIYLPLAEAVVGAPLEQEAHGGLLRR